MSTLINIPPANDSMTRVAVGGLGVDVENSLAHLVGVIEKHLHPATSSAFPQAKYRVGAIQMTAATDTETVTVGATTYHILTALGSPGANEAHVKIQGTVAATRQKLADAINGETDGDNIAYGSGVVANASATAYVTGNRFAINDTQVAAGNNIMLVAKTADEASPPTLSETGAGMTVTAFARPFFTRYLLTGNSTAVAGAYQTLIPRSRIATKYDPWQIVLVAISTANMVVNADLYYSSDESSYTLVVDGLALSKASTDNGSERVTAGAQRIPADAGLYMKARSDEALDTEYADVVVQYHAYPDS